MSARQEPSLVSIHHKAQALAGRRNEGLSRVHFLAVLGNEESLAARLLVEHGASPRRVLSERERFTQVASPENWVQLSSQVQAAARRFGARSADASHLLLVLLNEPGADLRKIFESLAVDIPRLRAALLATLPELPARAIERTPVSSSVSRPLAALTPRAEASRPTPIPVASVGAWPNSRSGVHKPGEAISIVPDVGPVPLPGRKARPIAREIAEIQEVASGVEKSRKPEGPEHVSFEHPAAEPQGDKPRAEVRDAFERLRLDPKRFPILTGVGKNLTYLAASGALDPVVGRDEEIEQALDILAKRQGNNPCLIGAAGVGKTSVARGIAAALANDESEVEPRLVIEIPIAELFAGTGVRGALAGRLNALKREVAAAEGRVVLFFDEIHQLFTGEASEEIASDLRLSLSRGELPCIGATSGEDFRRVLERDAGIMRRFSAIELEEPSREDAFLILSSVAQKLARHHAIEFDDEALAVSIAWSLRYLPGRALPDKAVSIIDLAGARAKRRGKRQVTIESVAEVVAGQASMPIERLLASDADRMLGLEEILRNRVIGHEEPLRKIARILRRNAAGIGGRRPIGTFLLLGPTGVGKTETAKAIAEVLFHSESAMTRIDMAEMSEAHSVSKLVGAPPGYVGHDAGGLLTEAIRKRPYQVLLLDEIEKAHPEVLTAFLAVFDEGRMTDSRGRTVDFTNSVIILTSNLGASEASATPRKKVGFGASSVVDSGAKERVTMAARSALPPELYNRLDEVLAFEPLTRADMRSIAEKLAQGLGREVFENRGIRLKIESSALEHLLDAGGFDPELGARPLRRTLARLIEAPLAEAILAGSVNSGDNYVVAARDGGLFAKVEGSTQAAAE